MKKNKAKKLLETVVLDKKPYVIHHVHLGVPNTLNVKSKKKKYGT